MEVKGHKFPARYLGYHPVEESDLVPGECVKVVHDSIKKINTAGQHDKVLARRTVGGLQIGVLYVWHTVQVTALGVLCCFALLFV